MLPNGNIVEKYDFLVVNVFAEKLNFGLYSLNFFSISERELFILLG